MPPGHFLMGSNDHYPEEAPAHRVHVQGFWIDPYAVTNAQFAGFVAETGYVTVAEQPPDPAWYPDADPSMREPASVVFTPPAGRSACTTIWSGGRSCRARPGGTREDPAPA